MEKHSNFTWRQLALLVSMSKLSNSINLVITCHDHLISSCQRYVAILICSNAAIVRNILYLGGGNIW